MCFAHGAHYRRVHLTHSPGCRHGERVVGAGRMRAGPKALRTLSFSLSLSLTVSLASETPLTLESQARHQYRRFWNRRFSILLMAGESPFGIYPQVRTVHKDFRP